MPVTVGPSTLTINHDRQFLISQPNATMAAQDDVGFYARDTRFVSGYGVTINGRPPRLLDAITVEHFSARYEFMTPELHLGPATDAQCRWDSSGRIGRVSSRAHHPRRRPRGLRPDELCDASGAASVGNADRVRFRRRLRRAKPPADPARRSPDHLASPHRGTAQHVSQPELPACVAGESREAWIEARVRQRPPGFPL